jgi:hypothetical protein
MPRPPPPGRLAGHWPSAARTASRRLLSRISHPSGEAMTIVHYYLGRPARVWIAANSRRSPARQARKGSGRVHSGIPASPREDSPFGVRCGARINRCPLAPLRQPEVLRDGDIRPSPRPRRRPAGPPPDRDRPLRHRRDRRGRHRPGPGRRTGPGRLPGRARRRTPGLGTCQGLPGAM